MRQKEVSSRNYCFDQYIDINRWASYYRQISEIVRSGPDSILVIGVGDGIVPAIIKHALPDTLCDTFDFDEDLGPDIVGDVRNISEVVEKKYDCVLCCQVLEHIDYSYFSNIIGQLSEICLDTLILSLPVSSYTFQLIVNFPKFHNKFLMNVKLMHFWKKDSDYSGTQHFWEVGIKNRQIRDIKRILCDSFSIQECKVYCYNPKHLFCVLRKTANRSN